MRTCLQKTLIKDATIPEEANHQCVPRKLAQMYVHVASGSHGGWPARKPQLVLVDLPIFEFVHLQHK